MQRICTLALLGLAACTPTTETGEVSKANSRVVAQVPVTDDFNEIKTQWTGGMAPGYLLRWDAVEGPNNAILICGTGVFLNGQLRAATQQSLRNGYVEFDGKTVARDLSFFSTAKTANAIKSTPANCINAGAPKGRVDRIGIHLGSASIRN